MKITPQYISGFFDGEGCVYILFRGKTNQQKPQLRISMVQKDKRVLDLIQAELGMGTISPQRDCWQWFLVRAEDISQFCDVVLPFSVVKYQELTWAKAIAQVSRDKSQTGRHRQLVRNLLSTQAIKRGTPVRTKRKSRA